MWKLTALNPALGVYKVMAPVKLRDVVRLLLAVVLTAILFGFWLATPVLEHLSQNQWRGVAVGVAALFGILWSVAQWNMSTLVAGFMAGLLVGGTTVALPISHGRIGNAFKGNLELLGADMIVFTVAAAISAYCASHLVHNYGYIFTRRGAGRSGDQEPL